MVKGRLASAHSHDDDAAKGGADLAVAASSEPMAVGLAAGRWDWTCAAELGQGRFRADALAVVANEQKHFGRSACAHAVGLDHVRGELLFELLKLSVKVLDLDAQAEVVGAAITLNRMLEFGRPDEIHIA